MLNINLRSLSFLLLLNIISNISFCIYHQSSWAYISMIGTAGVIAVIEYLAILILKIHIGRKSAFIAFFTFLLIHNAIIIVDYFLIFRFHMVFNQDVVDILAETNHDETANFINTYISYKTIGIAVLLILSFNYLCWKICRMLSKNKKVFIGSILAISGIGLFVIGRMFYSFILYKDGLSVPQYIAPMRIVYASSIFHQRSQEIQKLRHINQNCEVEKEQEIDTDIVLIIGESFSKYHCSLYGYEKQTYPLLEERRANGELLVYNDAVCIADATHRNMKAIFSLASQENNFGEKPLFPGIFKAAGYNTVLLDNQYFINSGVTFLTDFQLSHILWNKRNESAHRYDETLLDEIPVTSQPSLYVFHLMGQHYQYEQRYPKEFYFFKPEDYASNHTQNQREIIAHYDNASLYNDYVVNQIINRFEDKNCIVIYISDHGEEIFDLSDYMGHGTSMTSKDYRYQLSIPFLIWVSKSYQDEHPQTMQKLVSTTETPIFTKYISHFLIDLAGIKTKDSPAELSFINDSYKKEKHRIVMNSFDYDKQ